jgi:hypothetical protein
MPTKFYKITTITNSIEKAINVKNIAIIEPIDENSTTILLNIVRVKGDNYVQYDIAKKYDTVISEVEKLANG